MKPIKPKIFTLVFYRRKFADPLLLEVGVRKESLDSPMCSLLSQNEMSFNCGFLSGWL